VNAWLEVNGNVTPSTVIAKAKKAARYLFLLTADETITCLTVESQTKRVV
jgi:hypothetical protein